MENLKDKVKKIKKIRLNTGINYADYISESIDKSISYAEYISENMDRNYSLINTQKVK